MTRRELLQAAAAGALPSDGLIAEALRKAAEQNVLAAVNPKVFDGYFSVCADGRGFGYGNTYPSLDGHQMSDALLWLGQVHTVVKNFAYVRGFMRADGCLPIAILPASAGKDIGPTGYPGYVEPNGGLYEHWVPGNPLAALGSPTYIQNADVIFRHTQDRDWLRDQLDSLNRTADFLATLVTPVGAVRGNGYYIERPLRRGCDGVTQPHAVDAFLRVARLDRLLGHARPAARYEALAARIRRHFITRFWVKDHFAEYLHPERGLIDNHGLSDTNWAALAFGALTPAQQAVLWKGIGNEAAFYYGGMPTGIVTNPAAYEAWEFSHPDRMDLAAMGRVWYLEAQARAHMADTAGIMDSVRRVCATGRDSGWYWRERYNAQGGFGAQKYCEYPANLIRIMHRFVHGIDLRLDGSVVLAPLAASAQTLTWRNRTLDYRTTPSAITGTYQGPEPQRLTVRLGGKWRHTLLPASPTPRSFELRA